MLGVCCYWFHHSTPSWDRSHVSTTNGPATVRTRFGQAAITKKALGHQSSLNQGPRLPSKIPASCASNHQIPDCIGRLHQLWALALGLWLTHPPSQWGEQGPYAFGRCPDCHIFDPIAETLSLYAHPTLVFYLKTESGVGHSSDNLRSVISSTTYLFDYLFDTETSGGRRRRRLRAGYPGGLRQISVLE